MYDKTQLMRGSLEGCILKIIEQHMTYGYEILMNMKEAGWIDVTEGTLYPILLRLEKLHYIRAEKRDSPLGVFAVAGERDARKRPVTADFSRWTFRSQTAKPPLSTTRKSDFCIAAIFSADRTYFAPL